MLSLTFCRKLAAQCNDVYGVKIHNPLAEPAGVEYALFANARGSRTRIEALAHLSKQWDFA